MGLMKQVMKSKARFILVSSLILVASNLMAQDANLLFDEEVKMSWLGIDYYEAKFVGDFNQFFGAGEQSVAELRDQYFLGWNMLVINEPEKYDVAGMFKRSSIFYDVDMIFELNSSRTLDGMQAYNSVEFSPDDIIDMVLKYDLEKLNQKEGYGVVMICESMNKSKEEAYYHLVVFNIGNREVVMQERLRGEPRGFGMRNYWAGAVYSIIKDVKKYKNKTW